MVVPVFLPHLGCGDRCTYCRQDLITAGGMGTPPGAQLAGIEGPFEVGLYGGSVFGIPLLRLREIFAALKPFEGRIAGIRVSTKPLPLDEEILEVLKDNGVTVVEFGIPTFDDGILSLLNRGHTVEDLRCAHAVAAGRGFDTALQVMVGLPGETRAHVAETVKGIIDLNPSYVRIYPLVVLRGTPLGDTYLAGGFEPVAFGEALLRALFIYLSLAEKGIPVVKMGLTANEVVPAQVLAGFYHPAFGFLVRAEAFFRAVRTVAEGQGIEGEVTVELNEGDIPHLVGDRRSNMMRLAEAGLRVRWETAKHEKGTFRMRQGDRGASGTVLDALSSLGPFV